MTKSKLLLKFDKSTSLVPKKPTFFGYLKAAFNNKVPITGVGGVPINKMLVGTAVLLGAWNPPFWLLGLVGESIYLGLMAHNKNFRGLIRGEQLLKLREAWEEKQARILKTFDSASHERYDRLVDSCASILDLPSSAPRDPLKDLRLTGLNKLIWMFLKLLGSRIRITGILTETSKDELQKDITVISEKIDMERDNSRLFRSLKSTKDIGERRLENFVKAEKNLKVVEAELERIEKQVSLLKEEASISSNPGTLSVRLDNVMDSLSDTNRWMSEQTELFGFLEETSIPDEFIHKALKPKADE
ncbi:MAG: hypothetical protein GY765_24640 [bacterium]|nr:hypothetical protein [bacterium]